MPNRCENTVYIRTKKPEDIQEIIDAIRGEGLFRHFVPRTDEVRKNWILESLFSYNGEDIREKLGLKGVVDKPLLDWKEMGFNECPYKQLWYEWQVENWGAKRDYRDKDFKPYEYEEGKTYLEIWYESPRSPHLKGRKKISEKLKADIRVEFSEPGMCFSGEYHYIDGELVECEDYSDAYFGNGEECPVCHGIYDGDNPDDWKDDEHTMCTYCDEDLNTNNSKHEDK